MVLYGKVHYGTGKVWYGLESGWGVCWREGGVLTAWFNLLPSASLPSAH